MGRYTRRAKNGVAVAVIEVPHHPPLSILTRARTLALRRLQKPPAPDPSLGYLELRSRRLEKSPRPASKPREGPKASASAKPTPPKGGPCPNLRKGSFGSVSLRICLASMVESERSPEVEAEAEAEVSFGENVLDAEARDRNSRETTPCSLMRYPETMEAPGSTTRPNSTANSSTLPGIVYRGGAMPAPSEIDEFFAIHERCAQQQFMEKYNFDVVNECPLPGRYEWANVCPGL